MNNPENTHNPHGEVDLGFNYNGEGRYFSDEVYDAFHEGFSVTHIAPNLLENPGLEDAVSEELSKWISRLSAAEPRIRGDRIASMYDRDHAEPDTIQVRPHTFSPDRHFLGQVEPGRRGSVQAILVREGNATLQVMRGKKAEEFELRPGSIALLDSSDNDEFRPWFTISSDSEVKATIFEHKDQVANRVNRANEQHMLGAKNRRLLAEMDGRKSQRQAKKLGKLLAKNHS